VDDQIKAVFGVRGRRVILYTDSGLKNELPSATKPESLAGQTLFVGPLSGTEGVSYTAVATPVCHFVNVECSKGGNKKGTLLLENPRGKTLNIDQLLSQVLYIFFFLLNCKYIYNY
jgi:hypothetical protein